MYVTGKNSWYPLPENSLSFEDLKMPKPFPHHLWVMKARQWCVDGHQGMVVQKDNKVFDKKQLLQKLVHYQKLFITRNYEPLSPKGVMVRLIPNKKSWSCTQIILICVRIWADVDKQEIIQNEIGNEAPFFWEQIHDLAERLNLIESVFWRR